MLEDQRNETEIKVGDVVTVDFGQSEFFGSNSFVVLRKLEGESVLHHPLAPEICIIRKDSELNRTLGKLKNSEEKQLEYCLANLEAFNFDAKAMLQSLCFYYVVQRRLSANQRQVLADLCGEVASVYCNYDVSIAMRLITDNEVLLDEYNRAWYEKFYRFFSGKKPATGVNLRSAIFNIAGFVLAQLQESRVSLYNRKTEV